MLNRGTKAMIANMLRDLALPVDNFAEWSVKHLASNFLARERAAQSWRDFWLDTWDVSVRMNKPATFEAHDSAPVATSVQDSSWNGRSMGVPETCMVIADFYDALTIGRGKIALNWLGQPGGASTVINTILRESPKIPRRELTEVRAAFEQRKRDRPDSGELLKVKGQLGHPRRLIVEMASDLHFFEEGANLALAVGALCEAIGGTTRWSERAKRLKLQS